MKPRLWPPGVVASPRDATGHRCGSRLARQPNPSVLQVPHSANTAVATPARRQCCARGRAAGPGRRGLSVQAGPRATPFGPARRQRQRARRRRQQLQGRLAARRLSDLGSAPRSTSKGPAARRRGAAGLASGKRRQRRSGPLGGRTLWAGAIQGGTRRCRLVVGPAPRPRRRLV